MTVYIVGNITVRDADTYKDYSGLIEDTLKKYGGCVVVRAGGPGKADVIEKDFRQGPARFVDIGFESKATALKGITRMNIKLRLKCSGRTPRQTFSIFDEVPVRSGPTRDRGAWL